VEQVAGGTPKSSRDLTKLGRVLEAGHFAGLVYIRTTTRLILSHINHIPHIPPASRVQALLYEGWTTQEIAYMCETPLRNIQKRAK
jgi:hypothetical protein